MSQADNIKDKNNRKSVIHILKIIKSRIKLYNKNSNGYIILCGISEFGEEIFHCIEPLNPIKSFYYECSKKFNINIIEELFIKKGEGNIILISGDECIIYEYNGIFRKIKSINANLIKRHSKGGQSSVRFSRLAEESRLHYITHCIDYINDLCNVKNSHIYGSMELKTQLLNHFTLKIKLKTENKFCEFNNSTINNSYFIDIIDKNNKLNNDDKFTHIIECIDMNPDILVFTEEEIDNSIENIEYIIVVKSNIMNDIKKKYPNKDVYLININNSCYSRLKDFIVIGKKYYIN